ncbi:SMP-30/gluconolactonase/LRE family protein [Amycolatopsis alkalitolerans]|uniref:hypothetical protein n=1 Tax=Amycolatopsis alkalitolerans TaxID=2547244 RepID=UPI00190F6F23|nr:hypothetical protein [Amycolatopsis alkalitolerans]
MPMAPVPEVTLTPVAYFPEEYFPENLAVRADGSVLVTAVLQQELWLVPRADSLVEPVLVHRFDHPVTGLAEVGPDVFVISVTEGYTTHESHLVRIDLNGWRPGDPASPETVFSFDDERVRALNGSCLLGPGVLAVADCFAGLIWRVDLGEGARSATARVWLAHDTMADDPDSEVAPPPQPGVNGVRYSARRGYLYYTSTAQQVFMRVPVDPDTLDPAGGAEFVAAVDNADDFCVDADAGFAYVTRHRASTLDRVPLEPRHGSEVRHVAGDPFDEALIGPSSAAWGRDPGDHGRVLYVTTDGGTTAPPGGTVRNAALLRAELRPGHQRSQGYPLVSCDPVRFTLPCLPVGSVGLSAAVSSWLVRSLTLPPATAAGQLDNAPSQLSDAKGQLGSLANKHTRAQRQQDHETLGGTICARPFDPESE